MGCVTLLRVRDSAGTIITPATDKWQKEEPKRFLMVTFEPCTHIGCAPGADPWLQVADSYLQLSATDHITQVAKENPHQQTHTGVDRICSPHSYKDLDAYYRTVMAYLSQCVPPVCKIICCWSTVDILWFNFNLMSSQGHLI